MEREVMKELKEKGREREGGKRKIKGKEETRTG